MGVVGLLLASAASAGAVTLSIASDEVGGASVAARTTAQNLRSAWLSQVAANGGAASAPMTLTQPTYTNGAAVTGVINTAADGTTTSVARTRYSAGDAPTFVGASTNPGTTTCTTSGTSLQGGAPRPTSLESNAACSTAAGFAYATQGGVGENTTRDAVEFTFSRGVLGFGAWFGDLETRTDGNGVAAVVRLYGAGNVLLSDQVVQPGPSYLPQSNCGGTFTGCGNNTTRWIGFVADPALPVTRMVVIVGDDDDGGNALDEGIGLIGPTLDLSTATISLAKSAHTLTDTNLDGVIGAGDTVSYDLTVTNTGTVPVSALSITDPGATGLSCPPGNVAPAAVATCTGTHVLTQAEVDSGALSNTATASATAYGGKITSIASTVVVPIPSIPGLSLSKTVDEPTFAAVGDVLHFEVAAANTGNVSLTGLSVKDPNPGTGGFTSSCPAVPGALAPGSTSSCDVTYTVTQADLDAGSVTNQSSATATAPGAVSVGPATAAATSSAVQQVGLTLQKAVDQPTYDAVGDNLTYTVTATNSGNVTLTGVSVTDPAPGAGAHDLDCAGLPATLSPGNSGACTATYTVTQDDLDAGSVTNIASAEATVSGNLVFAPDAQATSTVVIRPGLSIVKTVDEPSFSAVGDELSYLVTVTNTGNVRVHGVTLSDASPGPGAFDLDCSVLPAALPAGASGSCTATYTVTQAGLDASRITNSAQASALLPDNTGLDSPVAAASSVAQQLAALSLVKSVDVAGFDAVGDVLTYTLDVTNAGNVTLTGVTVSDPAPGNGTYALDCPAFPGTLSPGDTGTCTATYAVTQADLDGGAVTNVASATATSPGGTVDAPESQATSTAAQASAMTATKTVDSDVFAADGDTLNYIVEVTNTGNVTLRSVSVTDPAPGSGQFTLDCDSLPALLPPGGSGTCTASYGVTQQDVDNGQVTNTATADATTPGGPISVATSPVTSIALRSASLEMTKTVDAKTYDAIGDVLTYLVTVTNSGSVTMSAVAVSDASPGAGAFDLDCAALPQVLAPGNGGTCTATYTVTQADLDAGQVVNRTRASATDPGGQTLRARASATSTAEVTRGLELTKTVAEASFSAVGDVLHYRITAHNTGSVTLTNVGVSDPAPGKGRFTTTCGTISALAPGAVSVCTASYTVYQRDLEKGHLINTASAMAPGQVDTVTSSATSDLERSALAETGARALHHAALIGFLLVASGAILLGLDRRRRPTANGS